MFFDARKFYLNPAALMIFESWSLFFLQVGTTMILQNQTTVSDAFSVWKIDTYHRRA